jgi:hypothetical protein
MTSRGLVNNFQHLGKATTILKMEIASFISL